jgi:hypothetical protein
MTCEIINFSAAKKQLAKMPPKMVSKSGAKSEPKPDTRHYYLNEDGEEMIDMYICRTTGYLMEQPNGKCDKITFHKEDCPKDLDEYNHALDIILGDW